jgi:hypothetical protein
MKTLITLKNINNKVLYYLLVLIRDPIFLLSIMTIIHIILFIYFFADPILCEGEDISVSPQISETPSGDNGNDSHIDRLNGLRDNIERYKIIASKARKDHEY